MYGLKAVPFREASFTAASLVRPHKTEKVSGFRVCVKTDDHEIESRRDSFCDRSSRTHSSLIGPAIYGTAEALPFVRTRRSINTAPRFACFARESRKAV